MNTGPQTEAADLLHSEKYRLPRESFREAMNRVAAAMANRGDEQHFKALRNILLTQRFLPAGRIQSAMGSGRQVTAFNCFVSGTLADVMTGGESSIMGRQTQAIETLRRGGGIGYDFSTIRPRGAPIKKLESVASGPVSFMSGFHAWAEAVSSTGHRRGAQMGVLRIDHPDIEEFIRAKVPLDRKRDPMRPRPLNTFNISVAVTDEFVAALERDELFPLQFDGQVHRFVYARDLWEQIMRTTWDWDDPGVLFIDRINAHNNLNYCEDIAATNPCGEQPLPPHGACLLGSFNLAQYVRPQGMTYAIDFEQLAEDVPVIVAAMDNIIDRTAYPLHEQEREAEIKRRMGLGVTGLANAVEALGHRYGSDGFVDRTGLILRQIRNWAYSASARLAQERGAFRAFERDAYLAAPFIETLPDPVRDQIAEHGIRNSHLLSIAPTGTISMCADNVSSGIEPTFARVTRRPINTETGVRVVDVQDYAVMRGWCEPTPASEVTIDEHLAVAAEAARNVDSGVSKTINLPHTTPWDRFKNIYREAYAKGIRGITTYVSDPAKSAVLTDASDDSCLVNAETGERDCG